MVQFYVLLILALIISMFFVRFLFKSFFFKKQKGSAKDSTKNRMFSVISKFDENKPKFWDDFRIRVIDKYTKLRVPILGLNKANKEYLELLIDTIDDGSTVRRTPETIRFTQIAYLTIYVLICILVSLVWKYAIIGLLLGYIVYKIPISSLKNKYENDCKEIFFQFPSFYDSVYAQYSKKDGSVLLTDVVSSYLPISTGSFRKLLRRFLIDLDNGEDDALKVLDKRYSSSMVIHKFCSIMRLRLKGDDASYLAMLTFRDSLQAEVKDWMMADLEKRKKTANKITVVMVTVILSIVMIIYFATFIKMGVF